MSRSSPPAASAENPANLSGTLLVGARCGWFALVAMAIGVFLLFLPHYYSHNVSSAISLAQEHVFIEVGLKPAFIAAFVTVRDVIVVGVFLAIAIAILRRGTGNVIALFVSLMLVFTGVMTPRVLDAPMESALWPLLAILIRYLGKALFITFLYVFPDGRLRPRWTRLAVGAWLGLTFVLYLGIEVTADPAGWWYWVQNIADVVWLSGGVLAQVWRYRRLSGPVERQQTRWVIWGFGVLALAVTAVHVSRALLISRYGYDLGISYYDLVAITVFGFIPVMVFPLTIAFSILRYRLWDLGAMINRGLLYATLTGLLGVMLFAVLALLQTVVHTITGQDSDLVVLASALIIVALAQPIRRRLQSLIDRSLYRAKFDAERAVDEFVKEMRTTVDLSQLVHELLARTTRHLYIRHGAVYLLDDAACLNLAEHQGLPEGAAADRLELGAATRMILLSERAVEQGSDHIFMLLVPLLAVRVPGNELVGVIALGPRESGEGYSREDQDLLMRLGYHAGTAIYVARLTEVVRETEERYRKLVDASPDAIVLTDAAAGRILICNEHTVELFGCEHDDQILGRTLLSFVPEEERQRAIDYGLRTLETGSIRNVEYAMLRQDGTRFFVELNGCLVRDSDGQATGFVAILRDISKRKRAEQKIRELNENLERRVIERTQQLEAAKNELEAFAYSVSHDLRSPLRAIDGFSQILLEDYSQNLDEAGQHTLDRVRAASQRMDQLIDDLLTLSRVTRRNMLVEEVDLTALASEIVADLRSAEPERSVTVKIANDVTAFGDARLLRIALENLLGNAWKFTGRKDVAEIEFGTARIEGETVCFVRDNGAGFAVEYADKLFGAFQRLHSHSEFAGTGIGLATVERVVRRHGGRVWAEGRVDEGAKISFTLELSRPE